MKKVKYNVHEHWLLSGGVCLAIDIIPKREVNARFVWTSRKIKVFELKTGRIFYTTAKIMRGIK